MTDSVHCVGEDPQLVGVLTQPEGHLQSSQDFTVLILNSGLLGRIGPYRLHVQMARYLAIEGFTSFRVDLSGIGDSDRNTDNRTNNERHLGDIKETMTYLSRTTNINKFIIMGICTGADYAHKIMVLDSRCIGAVCIDGYSYQTTRYYFNYYLSRIFSFSTIVNTLKNIFSNLAKEKKLAERELNYRWEIPEKQATEMDYNNFIASNQYLLNIFTSEWRYNYLNQLSDALPNVKFGNNIRFAFLKNANHTFTVDKDRCELIVTISDWLKKYL
jgi:hypothetical protein